MPHPTHAMHQPARRGNTIVLVTAILVLLVIIATAFISRTRAVRQVSAAQQASAGRDGRGESIGVDVAREIADALFAKPVDTNPATGVPFDPFVKFDASVTPPVVVASSSFPRLVPAIDASRYSIDRDLNGDGVPDLPYNAAPYETKAWTNWPDFFGGAAQWPFGAGAPQGALVDGLSNPMSDGNPYGNPGYGDSRWLRSTEPERIGVDQGSPSSGPDGAPDAFTFSHWSHLSWLPSANNGWRVVADIGDIGLNTVDNMNENAAAPYAVAWPYEQWLPSVVPAGIANAAEFSARRQQWFFNYPAVYATPLALPNFFQLKALGKPTDEFRAGTLRNQVSRTFTDTDGDGFTDSYWFLAPTPVDRGVRTIVGVSVVDNSALLNANVATKFSWGNTTGQTPADLALVTSVAESAPITTTGTKVGFLDAPYNQTNTEQWGSYPLTNGNVATPSYWTYGSLAPIGFAPATMRFDGDRFGDRANVPASFLQAIGMRSPNGGIEPGAPGLGLPLIDNTLDPALPRGAFESAIERLSYFKIGGGSPDQPLLGITPFDAADEFELRAYHGNNSPFTLSRFEQALSLYSPAAQGPVANDTQILRASPMREESDEYLDQLDARQLLVDNRRKLTMFSGARNDIAPPYLWQSPFYSPTFNYMNPRGAVPPVGDPNYAAFQTANQAEFERQKFKVDLRQPMFVDAAGNPQLLRNPFAAFQWRRDLARLLEASLTRYDPVTDTYESYYGNRVQDYRRTLSMIASYVANLDCASDEPQTLGTTGVAIDRPLYPSPPQQDPNGYFAAYSDAVADPFVQNRFYMGMEKQPFIMEVFFGLVYPKSSFDEAEWAGFGGSPPPPGQEELPPDVEDGGENFVDNTSKPKMVIAVQIANPHDTPISLGDFRVQVYGQSFSFAAGGIAGGYGPNPVLPAATLGRPSTAIVYAVANGTVGDYPAGAFKTAVLDFLDLEKGELNGGSFQQVDSDGDGLIEYLGLYDSQVDGLDRTLVFDATGTWKVDLDTMTTGGANLPYTNSSQPVQILRNVTPPPGVSGGPVTIVVDRFDNDLTGPEVEFDEAFQRLFSDPQFIPPPKKYNWDTDPQRRFVSGIRIKQNDFLMTWCRASRIWAWDLDTWDDTAVDISQKQITATERSPRYVFSMATEPVRSERVWEGVNDIGARLDGAAGYKGDAWKVGQDPDGDSTGLGRWASFTFVDMFGRNLRGKPVFFTNQIVLADGGTEVISGVGNDPMPFLGKLELPPGSVDVLVQDCHGTSEYKGVSYEWMIGNKGCRISDWNRFKNIGAANIPFQLTQKDLDFEQTGEILDVFLWGHVFENWGTNPTTVRTFSETMLDEDPDSEFYPGVGVFTNRLQIRLPGTFGTDDEGVPVLGARFDPASTTVPPAVLPNFRAWKPALPVGVAMFDGLTINGAGRNSFDRNANSQIEDSDLVLAELRSFRLANAGNGLVPGLVNLNTALPETMMAMPMMARLPRTSGAAGTTPHNRMADMVRAYRDRSLLGAPLPFLEPPYFIPGYGDRGLTAAQVSGGVLSTAFPADQKPLFPGMRNERGLASVGELLALTRTPPSGSRQGVRNMFSMYQLALDPYADLPSNSFDEYTVGYSWTTDRTNPRPRQLPPDILTGIGQTTAVEIKPHDEPLGDAEDANLLFKGISNLVTTRSDVFTVYLRVRQVKQNPVTGVWDGTNQEQVIDDTRYVMCVDRSGVNKPGDLPKILYFQKVPN